VNARHDIDLVMAGASGDEDALAEIVRRHQIVVRRFLRRLCGGDSANADDLAQETFLVAFDRLSSFRADSSLEAWLCGIAFRRHQSDVRGRLRRRRREQNTPDCADGAISQSRTVDARLDLQAAFGSLTLEQRAAAALCLLEDMSHSEAALALGVPLGTLKSRIAAAKKTLMQRLESYR